MKKLHNPFLIFLLSHLIKVVTVFALAVLFFGCQEKEKEKVEPILPEPVPLKLIKAQHSGGASRDFHYNAKNQIIGIKGKNTFGLSGNLNSESTIIYNSFNKIAEVITVGPSFTSKTKYLYNSAQQLILTEEYIDNDLQYYYSYHYNTQGKLITRYTFAPGKPESVTFKIYAKREYEYDARHNVSVLTEYTAGPQSNLQLSLRYQYLDYDDYQAVNHLLTYPHFTPELTLQKNNPAKEIRTLYPGGETLITRHAYAYNERRYPVKKSTTSSNNTSSEIIFTYTE